MKAKDFFAIGLTGIWQAVEAGEGRPETRATLYRDKTGGFWALFERERNEAGTYNDAMFCRLPRWEARSFLRRHKAPPEVLAEAFSRREATG